MTPTEPIHPFVAVFIAAVLAVGIAVRVAFTHGLGVGFAVLLVGGFAAFFVYCVAEMLTLPRDHKAWDIYREASDHDRYRFP